MTLWTFLPLEFGTFCFFLFDVVLCHRIPCNLCVLWITESRENKTTTERLQYIKSNKKRNKGRILCNSTIKVADDKTRMWHFRIFRTKIWAGHYLPSPTAPSITNITHPIQVAMPYAGRTSFLSARNLTKVWDTAETWIEWIDLHRRL